MFPAVFLVVYREEVQVVHKEENVVTRQPHTDDAATMPAGPNLGIDVEQRTHGPSLAHVAGEVDMLAASRVRDCVDQHLPDRHGFVLDLSDVQFLAASGLSILLEAERRAEQDDLDWAIVATDRPVTRPLEMTGLTDELPTYRSVDDAVAAVSSAVRGRLGND